MGQALHINKMQDTSKIWNLGSIVKKKFHGYLTTQLHD